MNKFCVIEGNNSELIRDALNKRGVWEEVHLNVETKENTSFQLKGGDLEIALKEAKFIWKPTNFSAKVLIYELENYSCVIDFFRLGQNPAEPRASHPSREIFKKSE